MKQRRVAHRAALHAAGALFTKKDVFGLVFVILAAEVLFTSSTAVIVRCAFAEDDEALLVRGGFKPAKRRALEGEGGHLGLWVEVIEFHCTGYDVVA